MYDGVKKDMVPGIAPEKAAVPEAGSLATYASGAIREAPTDRGMPHLFAFYGHSRLLADNETHLYPLREIERLLYEFGRTNPRAENAPVPFAELQPILNMTIAYLMKNNGGSYFKVMEGLAKRHEFGVRKYAKNNWRKGLPISTYFDSACRHLWHMIDGDTSEDHGSALLWNVMCIIQTFQDCKAGYISKEVLDFPFTPEELFGKKKEGKSDA